ncbi:hypothetical protein [Xanthomonas cassavae]
MSMQPAMTPFQADAIAQAVLHGDPAGQEALRVKHAKKAWELADRRKVAALGLIGFALGAALAPMHGAHWIRVGTVSSLGAAGIGWIRVSWRRSGRR